MRAQKDLHFKVACVWHLVQTRDLSNEFFFFSPNFSESKKDYIPTLRMKNQSPLQVIVGNVSARNWGASELSFKLQFRVHHPCIRELLGKDSGKSRVSELCQPTQALTLQGVRTRLALRRFSNQESFHLLIVLMPPAALQSQSLPWSIRHKQMATKHVMSLKVLMVWHTDHWSLRGSHASRTPPLMLLLKKPSTIRMWIVKWSWGTMDNILAHVKTNLNLNTHTHVRYTHTHTHTQVWRAQLQGGEEALS